MLATLELGVAIKEAKNAFDDMDRKAMRVAVQAQRPFSEREEPRRGDYRG
jgi:hypothetical protein